MPIAKPTANRRGPGHVEKLIIQIPCFNEEDSLPTTLAALPRSLAGVDCVEWLIIDDGSDDRTVEVARAHGVDHVVALPRRQGLATAFMAGLDACLMAKADIIVNTDADNQYNADDIAALIAPILEGKAELVVGCRPIASIPHFSPAKKLLQRMGSWVVRVVSKTDVPDAPSGFRAISRNAAMRTNVFSRYTYTLETLIQAGQHNMAVTWVPVRVNPDMRPSRLVRSVAGYVIRSLLTIVRIFVLYKAFAFLLTISLMLVTPGVILGARFLYQFAIGQGAGHVQSLILASLLISLGVIIAVTGVLADLVSVNRRILEDIRSRTMRLEQRMSLEDDKPSDGSAADRR